ncbi:hypothetical protein ACLRGF_05655 [Mycetocola zhadangensis]|uniref:hypothetical protein n=1 Tax=Mycetocola zhadangensis TaxID=1164595 RepID=UPI003A4E122A
MKLTPEAVSAAFVEGSGLTSLDVHPVLDWFTLGIVHTIWRNGPIEEVHAVAGSLSDGAMFQINTWLTHTCRISVADWMTSHPLDDIAQVREDSFVILLDALQHLMADPNQMLPHGRTLRSTAGRHLGTLLDDIDAKFHSMESIARDLSPASVIYYKALEGFIHCQSWWGTPGWPPIVDGFVFLLNDPDATHWHGRHNRLASRPAEVADEGELATALKTSPWALSESACDWLASAGIGYVDVYPGH